MYLNKPIVTKKNATFFIRFFHSSYRPLVMSTPAFRVLSGNQVFSSTLSIAVFAPSHLPGPSRRHCCGVQGPKTNFLQRALSLKKYFRRFGLHPIRLASLSMYPTALMTIKCLRVRFGSDLIMANLCSTSCSLSAADGS